MYSSRTENIIIQLQEDEEAVNQIDGNIIDDPDYEPTRGKLVKVVTTSGQTVSMTTPHQAVPPPLVLDGDKKIRDQLQKQKDMASAFGFKDDDEDDDAILSMPAAISQ